jgi:hypothetical protein
MSSPPNQPNWIPQGPGPIAGGADAILKNGAIETIAVSPVDPNRVLVGTIEGGIWRTTNALNLYPHWDPLTDQLPSLSIGDIAFSPLDNNTLFAGTGAYRSGIFGGEGGPAIGVLKTTDGGDSWVQVGQSTVSGRVRSVAPTAIATANGQVVLAAGDNGVFRSENSGNTFSLVSGLPGVRQLPFGPVTDLVINSSNYTRVYAAVVGMGLFRSDDGGVNWDNISSNIPATGTPSIADSYRIKLSVSAAAPFPVWAALISGTANSLRGLYQYNDQTGIWISMPLPPDVNALGQGYANFSIAAHPTDANVIFIAGDIQNGTVNVPSDARGDISTGSWVFVIDAGANGTRPHTDSRDMVFSPDGNILECDDGGIYVLIDPDNPATRHWEPRVGDIQVTQFGLNGVAYDPLNDILWGGCADNGTPEQSAPGSLNYTDVTGGDGGDVAVDISGVNDPHRAVTIRYTKVAANLTSIRRRAFDQNNLKLSDDPALLASPNTPTVRNSGLHRNAKGDLKTNGNYVINRVNSSRMLIGGTDGVFESDDKGDIIVDITIPGGSSFQALAYGGRGANGTDYPVFAYVAADDGLYMRPASGGFFIPSGSSFIHLTSYPGSGVKDLALHPYDLREAYATDGANVYMTTDTGATWFNITSNLPSLDAKKTIGLRTIEVYSEAHVSAETVVLVGGYGGVFRTINPAFRLGKAGVFWTKYGSGLPHTTVEHLRYIPAALTVNGVRGDMLLAGTDGRGIWAVPNASQTLSAGLLTMTIIYKPRECLGVGFLESVATEFSIKFLNSTQLVQPLTYRWTVAGAAALGANDQPKFSVMMPAAGNMVTVSATVTDASGYQISQTVTKPTLTAAEAVHYDRLCELLSQLRTIAIVNEHINPLGGDSPLDLGRVPIVHPDLPAIRQAAERLVRISQELLHTRGARETGETSPR